jgi:hypothetical protein
VAFQYYSCFSFVGGLVFKKDVFLKYNTAEYDGSIYSQIYHATLLTASGNLLFSIAEPVVIKDVLPEAHDRVSYLDYIPKRWRDYRKGDGGLPSVIHVLTAAFMSARVLSEPLLYHVFKRIYFSTFPYWIVNYRRNKALPAAIGLISAMKPGGIQEFSKLSTANRLKVYGWYYFSSIAGLLIPVLLFDFIAMNVLRKVKSRNLQS